METLPCVVAVPLLLLRCVALRCVVLLLNGSFWLSDRRQSRGHPQNTIVFVVRNPQEPPDLSTFVYIYLNIHTT
jgi:hypothetical protein